MPRQIRSEEDHEEEPSETPTRADEPRSLRSSKAQSKSCASATSRKVSHDDRNLSPSSQRGTSTVHRSEPTSTSSKSARKKKATQVKVEDIDFEIPSSPSVRKQKALKLPSKRRRSLPSVAEKGQETGKESNQATGEATGPQPASVGQQVTNSKDAHAQSTSSVQTWHAFQAAKLAKKARSMQNSQPRSSQELEAQTAAAESPSQRSSNGSTPLTKTTKSVNNEGRSVLPTSMRSGTKDLVDLPTTPVQPLPSSAQPRPSLSRKVTFTSGQEFARKSQPPGSVLSSPQVFSPAPGRSILKPSLQLGKAPSNSDSSHSLSAAKEATDHAAASSVTSALRLILPDSSADSDVPTSRDSSDCISPLPRFATIDAGYSLLIKSIKVFVKDPDGTHTSHDANTRQQAVQRCADEIQPQIHLLFQRMMDDISLAIKAPADLQSFVSPKSSTTASHNVKSQRKQSSSRNTDPLVQELEKRKVETANSSGCDLTENQQSRLAQSPANPSGDAAFVVRMTQVKSLASSALTVLGFINQIFPELLTSEKNHQAFNHIQDLLEAVPLRPTAKRLTAMCFWTLSQIGQAHAEVIATARESERLADIVQNTLKHESDHVKTAGLGVLMTFTDRLINFNTLNPLVNTCLYLVLNTKEDMQIVRKAISALANLADKLVTFHRRDITFAEVEASFCRRKQAHNPNSKLNQLILAFERLESGEPTHFLMLWASMITLLRTDLLEFPLFGPLMKVYFNFLKKTSTTSRALAGQIYNHVFPATIFSCQNDVRVILDPQHLKILLAFRTVIFNAADKCWSTRDGASISALYRRNALVNEELAAKSTLDLIHELLGLSTDSLSDNDSALLFDTIIDKVFEPHMERLHHNPETKRLSYTLIAALVPDADQLEYTGICSKLYTLPNIKPSVAMCPGDRHVRMDLPFRLRMINYCNEKWLTMLQTDSLGYDMQVSLREYWQSLHNEDQTFFGKQILNLRLDQLKTSCLFKIIFDGEEDYCWMEADFIKTLEESEPFRTLAYVRSAAMNQSRQGFLKTLLNILFDQALSEFELKHYNAWEYIFQAVSDDAILLSNRVDVVRFFNLTSQALTNYGQHKKWAILKLLDRLRSQLAEKRMNQLMTDIFYRRYFALNRTMEGTTILLVLLKIISLNPDQVSDIHTDLWRDVNHVLLENLAENTTESTHLLRMSLDIMARTSYTFDDALLIGSGMAAYLRRSSPATFDHTLTYRFWYFLSRVWPDEREICETTLKWMVSLFEISTFVSNDVTVIKRMQELWSRLMVTSSGSSSSLLRRGWGLLQKANIPNSKVAGRNEDCCETAGSSVNGSESDSSAQDKIVATSSPSPSPSLSPFVSKRRLESTSSDEHAHKEFKRLKLGSSRSCSSELDNQNKSEAKAASTTSSVVVQAPSARSNQRQCDAAQSIDIGKGASEGFEDDLRIHVSETCETGRSVAHTLDTGSQKAPKAPVKPIIETQIDIVQPIQPSNEAPSLLPAFPFASKAISTAQQALTCETGSVPWSLNELLRLRGQLDQLNSIVGKHIEKAITTSSTESNVP